MLRAVSVCAGWLDVSRKAEPETLQTEQLTGIGAGCSEILEGKLRIKDLQQKKNTTETVCPRILLRLLILRYL